MTERLKMKLNTATGLLDQIEVEATPLLKKPEVKTPKVDENGVPGNILKNVAPQKSAKNISQGVTSEMARKVAPKVAKNVGKGLGIGAGVTGVVAEEFRKAARQIKTGEISGGQFIGAEAPPVPSHMKAIQKVPIYFRSGNDLKTRELKI